MSDSQPADIPTGDSLPFDAPIEAGAAAPPEGGLDKIRDLLFGREMGDVDRRFARLEAHLVDEAAALRDEVTGRLDALEAYVKDELASLNAGLGQERRERAEAVEQASGEARARRETLSRQISDLQDASDQNAQVVRQRILDEATRAQTALRATGDEIQRALERRAATLDNKKADRNALAAIFAQAADRLKDDA